MAYIFGFGGQNKLGKYAKHALKVKQKQLIINGVYGPR